jgi:putative addiction module CopG family antidote
MTIDLGPDLARFVEDAVGTGRYNSASDVVRDALTRLRQVLEITAAATAEGGEPAAPDKPLTKQTLQQHLAQLGLVDQPAAAAPPVEHEDEIISDVMIRERLIEWLVGFLPRS